MIAILPQMYSRDFVDFLFVTTFNFEMMFFYKWRSQFNIPDFYKITNKLDPGVQFIFEEITTNIKFLDIYLKIINSAVTYLLFTIKESAKLLAIRAKNLLTCQCALRAYVLTCQRSLRAYVPTHQRALHAYVFTCQRTFRAYVLTW